jgi:hypothetical protein
MNDLPWSWTLPAGTTFEEAETEAVSADIPGVGRRYVAPDGSLNPKTSRFVPGTFPDPATAADWDAWVARTTGAPIPPRSA